MQQGTIWFLPWEESLIIWLQQLCNGTFLQDILVTLNKLFTYIGDDYLCIAILGFVYWGLDKRRGERIGAVFMSTNVSTTMLKNLFYRIRPWASSDAIVLLQNVGGYSFPSGHCTKCVIYPATAYEYRGKKALTAAAVILPLLCGISRCFLGAHWPTDVIVGLATGLLSFVLIEWGLAKVRNKYIQYFSMILFHGIGLFYCTTNGYYDSFGMLIGFTLGILFEEKFTRFENTKNIRLAILRTVIGGILYIGLNILLGKALSPLFAEKTTGYLLLRTVRSCIVTFLLIGVYPYAFALEKRLRIRQGKS